MSPIVIDPGNIDKVRALLATYLMPLVRNQFILKSEHEKVIIGRDKKMADGEKRTRDKESQVSQELDKNKKLNK